MKTSELTQKQQLFVKWYVATLNASEAARRAGYSEKTAYEIGHQNLRKVEVRAAVDALLKERHMTADEILSRLADHARGSFEPFLQSNPDDESTDEGIKLKLNSQSAKDNIHLIRSMKQKKTTLFKDDGSATEIIETDITLHDAQAALVHLGKAAKLFKDQLEHSGPNGEPLAAATPVLNVFINGLTPTLEAGDNASNDGD